MRKWVKRALLTTAAVTTMAAGLSYWLFQREPDWYRPRVLDPAHQEALARRAEDALIGANNWADELKAHEARSRTAGTVEANVAEPSPAPKGSHSVAFSEEELNALFQKWSQWNGWNERLAKYVTDPVIALRRGNLILAGKVKDLGAVASFHFTPEIDPQGRLTLKLARVMAGKLPMPKAVWTSQRDRMAAAVTTRLPAWQAAAEISPEGVANRDTIAASMGMTMLDALNDRPAEPIIFIQSVPVRVTALTIVDEQLTATVVPLNSSERERLLQRIGASSVSASPVRR